MHDEEVALLLKEEAIFCLRVFVFAAGEERLLKGLTPVDSLVEIVSGRISACSGALQILVRDRGLPTVILSLLLLHAKLLQAAVSWLPAYLDDDETDDNLDSNDHRAFRDQLLRWVAAMAPLSSSRADEADILVTMGESLSATLASSAMAHPRALQGFRAASQIAISATAPALQAMSAGKLSAPANQMDFNTTELAEAVAGDPHISPSSAADQDQPPIRPGEEEEVYTDEKQWVGDDSSHLAAASAAGAGCVDEKASSSSFSTRCSETMRSSGRSDAEMIIQPSPNDEQGSTATTTTTTTAPPSLVAPRPLLNPPPPLSHPSCLPHPFHPQHSHGPPAPLRPPTEVLLRLHEAYAPRVVFVPEDDDHTNQRPNNGHRDDNSEGPAEGHPRLVTAGGGRGDHHASLTSSVPLLQDDSFINHPNSADRPFGSDEGGSSSSSSNIVGSSMLREGDTPYPPPPPPPPPPPHHLPLVEGCFGSNNITSHDQLLSDTQGEVISSSVRRVVIRPPERRLSLLTPEPSCTQQPLPLAATPPGDDYDEQGGGPGARGEAAAMTSSTTHMHSVSARAEGGGGGGGSASPCLFHRFENGGRESLRESGSTGSGSGSGRGSTQPRSAATTMTGGGAPRHLSVSAAEAGAVMIVACSLPEESPPLLIHSQHDSLCNDTTDESGRGSSGAGGGHPHSHEQCGRSSGAVVVSLPEAPADIIVGACIVAGDVRVGSGPRGDSTTSSSAHGRGDGRGSAGSNSTTGTAVLLRRFAAATTSQGSSQQQQQQPLQWSCSPPSASACASANLSPRSLSSPSSSTRGTCIAGSGTRHELERPPTSDALTHVACSFAPNTAAGGTPPPPPPPLPPADPQRRRSSPHHRLDPATTSATRGSGGSDDVSVVSGTTAAPTPSAAARDMGMQDKRSQYEHHPQEGRRQQREREGGPGGSSDFAPTGPGIRNKRNRDEGDGEDSREDSSATAAATTCPSCESLRREVRRQRADLAAVAADVTGLRTALDEQRRWYAAAWAELRWHVAEALAWRGGTL